ncbi:hypothetical protein GCM10022252_18580 [Streptosporangium oxazolinicum]|uniref:Transposase n=1 Tax=Streptosporangium oxazolinicum TaxID=909287 RepID=A0ABP8AMU3_9ACTN
MKEIKALRERSTSDGDGGGGEPKLFLLPAHPPKLNPGEQGWGNAGHDHAGRAAVHGVHRLRPTFGGDRAWSQMPKTGRDRRGPN